MSDLGRTDDIPRSGLTARQRRLVALAAALEWFAHEYPALSDRALDLRVRVGIILKRGRV